jgi:DNA repair exonuclease SbcCD ATPase subunit
MPTKQERKTQKKLLKQRDDARTQAESLASEVERLKGDVNVLAAEEIRKATAQSTEALRTAEAERDRAVRERDALLKDFDRAIAVKLDETQKELEATQAKLAAAQKQVLSLVGRNSTQSVEISGITDALERRRISEEALAAELSSLRMEDAKQLRKRLQVKTERVTELEREVAQLKAKPASGPVAPTVPGLSALLNAKLRRKLAKDGKATVETADEVVTIERETQAPPGETSAPAASQP